jgi:hypothetical protein
VVGALKNNARVYVGGIDRYFDHLAAVETNPYKIEGTGQGSLELLNFKPTHYPTRRD